MHEKTDEQLITEIQNGQILSYEKIVRRYQNRLLSFVVKIVWNHEDAQEVVQDIFFSIYTHINQIDKDKKFSSYLYAGAKNMAITHLRKNIHNKYQKLTEVASPEHDLLGLLVKDESVADIHTSIASLGDKYRDILKLYYLNDFDYKEISKRTNLTLNTVRTRLKRAKEKLKLIMEES